MKWSGAAGALAVSFFCVVYAYFVVQRKHRDTSTDITRYVQKVDPLPKNVVMLKTLNFPYVSETGEPVVIEGRKQIEHILHPLYGKEQLIDERTRQGNFYMRAPSVELRIVPDKKSGEKAVTICLYEDSWKQDFGPEFVQEMHSLRHMKIISGEDKPDKKFRETNFGSGK